jgi:uncharacterized Zn finger protein (UPF0148 family)
MKVIPLNCPNCGAPLVLPDGKNSCFCSNCGSKVFVENGEAFVTVNVNINKRVEETKHITVNETKHIIDEAEIQKHKSEADTKSAIIGGVIIIVMFILVWLFIQFF